MRIVTPNLSAALAVAASIGWSTTAAALSDLVLNVDCASGARISHALSRPTLLDRRLVVLVSGTCNENLTIERDDVVLRAQGSGAGVSAADPAKPAILINAARRVTLEGLAVVGGLYGVHATDGASVTIRASGVRNAVRHGVYIQRGASGLVVEGSTVASNGQSGAVAEAASITITDSFAQDNGWSGVGATHGGSAFLGAEAGGNVCCGNQIKGNRFDGVTVAFSSMAMLYDNVIQNNGNTVGRFGILATDASTIALRAGNVISQNGGSGIFIRGANLRAGPGDQPLSVTWNEVSGNTNPGIQAVYNAYVDLRGGVRVTGNTSTGVFVSEGSRLRTDGSTITGNATSGFGPGIFVRHASSVEFFGPNNNISGNTGPYDFDCADTQPSYSGTLSTATRVGPNCTRLVP